ncbi:MAG: hypothetical protein IT304_02045, partial [Dehalococcoidia bacterium]|nr:hypothetical protein [Dehalococcoidia bacterium]
MARARRTWAIRVGSGAALAATLFAGGVWAGAALDDSATVTPTPASGLQVATGNAPRPAPDVLKDGTAQGGSGTASAPAAGRDGMGFAPSCSAPLDGVVAGGKLTPALGDFPATLPDEAFQLTAVALRAQRANCAENGAVVRALETSWLHRATGSALTVTQTVRAEPVPNTLTPSGATFWRGGFAYTVFGGPIMTVGVKDAPANQPLPPDTPVRTAPSSSPSADAVAVMVRQLAPDIPDRCFSRQRNGGWDDLRAIGVGDPRPALPSGLTEIQLSLTTWTLADPACPGPRPDPREVGSSFHAIFERGKGEGMLSLSAIPVEAGPASGPGHFGQGGANWTNDRLLFSLGWGGGISDAEARAVALALDPAFAHACLVTARPLTDAEFAALGLRAPVVPAGYQLEPNADARTRLETTGSCTPPATGGGFAVRWLMVSHERGGVIEVDVVNGPRDPSGSTVPYGGDQSLVWTDNRGYRFVVSG